MVWRKLAHSVVYACKALLKWKELRSAPAFNIHSFIFTEEGRKKEQGKSRDTIFTQKEIPIYTYNNGP